YGSPLEIRYFSATPYLFGTSAAKYSLRPRGTTITPVPHRAPDDFMKRAMKERLAKEGAEFDFLVQLRTDPRSMPIEDSQVEWDEARSPFVQVATLRIPAQDFDTPERAMLGDNLSFNPWHALPEHRPLGGINRARRVIYEALSAYRHERNLSAP